MFTKIKDTFLNLFHTGTRYQPKVFFINHKLSSLKPYYFPTKHERIVFEKLKKNTIYFIYYPSDTYKKIILDHVVFSHDKFNWRPTYNLTPSLIEKTVLLNFLCGIEMMDYDVKELAKIKLKYDIEEFIQ